ncbi:MAG TPA: hypothetical protein VGG89_04555 [Candidatus Baltobacteraceae bacterium]
MRYALLIAAFAFALTGAAYAAAIPSLTSSEKAFVAKASASLNAAYPTTSAAKTAGFTMLFDTIGDDNTYNWTNMSFAGVTPDHPNFLWYDRHGNLAGVDWEFPTTGSAPAPKLAAFPVAPARWVKIPEHVHYAYTLDGKMKYGVAKATPALRTGTITAGELRANGARLPKDAKLDWAMYHPAVWDLAMWTVPNPKGAFADKNPNVK